MLTYYYIAKLAFVNKLFYKLAGKKENYWRAIGEMDIARNTLIELLGYKYSLETKRFRNVDMFPDDIKTVLQKTMPVEFSFAALKKCLYLLTDAIYNELEAFYTKGNELKITRKDVKEYCQDVLASN